MSCNVRFGGICTWKHELCGLQDQPDVDTSVVLRPASWSRTYQMSWLSRRYAASCQCRRVLRKRMDAANAVSSDAIFQMIW